MQIETGTFATDKFAHIFAAMYARNQAESPEEEEGEGIEVEGEIISHGNSTEQGEIISHGNTVAGEGGAVRTN